MPPTLALVLWFILLLGLLRFDPAREPVNLLALWVPLIWMFIIASRLPSQWLGAQIGLAAQAFEEGNPLDRVVFSFLMLLSIIILVSRHVNWGSYFSRNLALFALIGFALLSFIWSDFPLISLKRWFRDLGNYLVLLVVLTDPRPVEAIRTFIRRLCYLLIPLSVVLIKYFPDTGKQFNFWSGATEYVGVTTGKNMLGAIYLISGIFFFWDFVTHWTSRKEKRAKQILGVDLLLLAMTFWLAYLTNSATSRVCLGIGCLVVFAAHSGVFRRSPGLLKALIPICFLFYLVLAFGFDVNGDLAGAVGRDPTLTDRTAIWKFVLAMHTNPLVGTGYESFWLGPRLDAVWRVFGTINQSHNGYLEVYLNQGLIGVALLVALIVTSYRNICKKLSPFSSVGSLSLAFWTITLFYNMTEAAFKIHVIWMVFLLIAIAVPERGKAPTQTVVLPARLRNRPQVRKPSTESAAFSGPHSRGIR